MQDLYNGIADILEVEVSEVTPELNLRQHAWDSLAIVSTIALVDELYNKIINGQSLEKCNKVSDIVALIGCN